MRVMLCVIVGLAVMIVGCAVPENSPSSATSIPALNNPEEQTINGDFDLLEEELSQKIAKVEDPLEPLNRIMFRVNDTLYFWLLKPVTQAYKSITPEPVRIGIGNFFQNLTTPIRFVNCHLQRKTTVADTELKRFLLNTTVGILGFGDPAKDRYGIEPPKKEDLGQTMATYGIGNGFYIVLPLLGPSTIRDSVGMAGDMFLNPVFYVKPAEAAISISAVKFTNKNSFRIGEYEAFKSAALDQYVAMREVYIQYRNKQIEE